MSTPRQVVVSGPYDNIRSHDIRFLDEAAKLGPLNILLWSDEACRRRFGRDPQFPLCERKYLLEAVRFVANVVAVDPDSLSRLPSQAIWVDRDSDSIELHRDFCVRNELSYQLIPDDELAGFPVQAGRPSGGKKVVVTGCFDWFHSGHVRFFEQASSFGDLYVVVGRDANLRLLKGEGHPLFPEDERCYMVGAVRHVTQALLASGEGWLDADPEIQRLKPDIYVVNEDGDKGGKREYCRANGIEYVVLSRTPSPGLPARSSTDLRGF